MSKRMGPKFRKGTRASQRARPATTMQRAKLRAAARSFGSVGRRGTSARRAILNATTAGFLGIEHKFYDTGRDAATVSASADCTGGEYDPSATSMISTPSQGDGEQNREGKRIMIDSVQVKGTLIKGQVEDAVNPSDADAVFIALILDTQSNGAQLNSEDVFKNPSASVRTASAPIRNLLFAERFRVLKSEVVSLDYLTLANEADNNFGASARQVNFDWYVPLQLPVNFNAGTTASIANVVDNSLHIVAFSHQGTALLSYNARIRFRG